MPSLLAALALGACEGSVDLGGGAASEAGADASAIEGAAGDGGDASPEVEAAALTTEAAAEDAAESSAPAVDSASDGAEGGSTDTGSSPDASCDGAPDVCAADPCADQIKDGLETDVDCGGPVCPGCGPRKGCLADSDCSKTLSGCDGAHLGCACDAVSGLCVNNQCIDHRQDGVETDVDCGGANACSRCVVGQKCNGNGDCQAGHTCGTGMPKVCQ